MRSALALFLFSLAAWPQALPNAAPMPTPEIQFLDQHGKPLAGAYLCSFQAGTSTPQATYTDSSAGAPNTNPIVLDVSGRASVWVGPQLYKFILYVGGNGRCPGTGAVQWSQDNVSDTTLYFTNYVKTAGTCTLISFIATASGAVSRTCSSKLGDLVSVKDFGALGDGSTDDTAAWQTALNTGAPLWCPAGTYIVQSLTVPNPDQQIFGAGMGYCTLKAKTSANGQVLDFASGSGHNQLANLTIDAHGSAYGIKCENSACFQNKYQDVEVAFATGTPGVGIFNTSNCYSQEWKGLRITDNNIGASLSSTCQATTIEQSKIYQNGSVNLSLGDTAGILRAISITDSDIETGTTSTTLHDIEITAVDPLVIHGTYFESGATSTSADLYFKGSGPSRVALESVFSNANITATHPIQINGSQVYMTVKDSYYFNSPGSTFDSETANNSVVQFISTAKANIGCTPSIPGCTSPTETDFTAPDATLTASLRSPWWQAVDQHSGNVLTMNSAGAKIGTLGLGTDTGNGSWNMGFSSSNSQTLGTPVLSWDGSGRIWSSPDTKFPSNALTRTLPGLFWDNSSQLTYSAAGQLFRVFGDTNRGADGKWWTERLLDSTGNVQFVSLNDDGSGRDQVIDMARNGGVGLNNAAACTNFNTCGGVVVANGLQLASSGTPTCSSTMAGTFYYSAGGAGVKDSVVVCAKAADGAYAWRIIY